MFNNFYYDLPNRRTTRLQSYDYRQPSYYYITICVAHGRHVLSDIKDGQVHLSPSGEIVQAEWNKLPERFRHVYLDQHVIMPNHFHGILIFEGPITILNDMATSRVPTRFREYLDRQGHVQRIDLESGPVGKKDEHDLPPLGEVVRTLKAAATYHIRKTVDQDFGWQSRLYEHVIRNVVDLQRIRQYILDNPASWQRDYLYAGVPTHP